KSNTNLATKTDAMRNGSPRRLVDFSINAGRCQGFLFRGAAISRMPAWGHLAPCSVVSFGPNLPVDQEPTAGECWIPLMSQLRARPATFDLRAHADQTHPLS